MGQKVHPYAFRLGPLYTWKSRWFADKKQYAQLVKQDDQIRNLLMTQLRPAGITDIEIERSLKKITIRLYVTRPGVVIGRGGSGIQLLKQQLDQIINQDQPDNKRIQLELNVEEVKVPELSAYFMATRIADQLAHRLPHQRVVKRAMEQIINAGAQGVKVVLSGRIGGKEISRTENFSLGSVPRQTIRSQIDYAQVPAYTKSGFIGVKVWIHLPEQTSEN